MAKIVSQSIWEDGPRTIIRIKLDHRGESNLAVEKLEISETNLHRGRIQVLLVLGPDGYISIESDKEGHVEVR